MEIPLPPIDSPWYKLAEIARPNIKWCEEQVAGWVIEPANTWSNLSYILLGLFLLYHTRRYKDPFLRLYGPGALLVGVGSFVYHMSYNFFTQILDFYGMYLIFLVPLLFNFRRLRWVSESNIYSYFILLTSFLTGGVVLMNFFAIPFQGIILGLIILILGTEIMLSRRKEPNRKTYKPFIIGIVFLAIGTAFSAMDATRVFCDPQNHFVQGHAIWHVMNTFTIWFSYKFYTQFDKSKFYNID